MEARTSWRPFLSGLLGITDRVADTSATAETTGEALGSDVMRVGVQDSRFSTLVPCPITNMGTCIDQRT